MLRDRIVFTNLYYFLLFYPIIDPSNYLGKSLTLPYNLLTSHYLMIVIDLMESFGLSCVSSLYKCMYNNKDALQPWPESL